MPKFVVRIAEVHAFDYEVEAKDREEAVAKAETFIISEDFETVYDYTLEPDDWTVYEATS